MSEEMSVEEYNALVTKKKESKYRNQKTEVDGITFDSKKEARRYGELKLMERAGAISNLSFQAKLKLYANDQYICTYIGDFMYWDAGGNMVIEDVKGVKTPVYRLKKKLVKAIYGIEIQEV